jgi:hypothetical protein
MDSMGFEQSKNLNGRHGFRWQNGQCVKKYVGKDYQEEDDQGVRLKERRLKRKK